MRGSQVALIVLAMAGLAGTARAGDYEDTVTELTANQPPAVAAVIQRRLACNRWFHGTAYDLRLAASPRAPFELRRLQCQLVDGDERLLRYRYRHAPDIRKAFDEADKAVF
ncbi:hypothetical protein ACO2Q3_26790 [Caulobacter sp. KR2-114]|uniref:hypothetical protein n=1 Tax=Caulobacter sp. KR2-114 TaxID=3400912 RepID=UPI003C117AC6